jgi:protein-S-isoprenylcysteine O-methyltransferase Ste14
VSGAQLRAILLLPANVLVTVPLALLWWEGALPPELAGGPALAAGLACLAVGVTLMVATIRLFHRVGRGSLAPWSPTRKLVVEGPYRYVRNPMISGVLFNLLGEALLFTSPAIAGWWALFWLGNAIYMPLLEEPGLRRRFGADYERYCRHVRRWLPRLSPWDPQAASPTAPRAAS